jgi:hypothetical protein
VCADYLRIEVSALPKTFMGVGPLALRVSRTLALGRDDPEDGLQAEPQGRRPTLGVLLDELETLLVTRGKLALRQHTPVSEIVAGYEARAQQAYDRTPIRQELSGRTHPFRTDIPRA